jgi:Raf kinase inhibitor-like YbhB/YbcL family protein
MRLTSSAFIDKGHIPKKYTCDGENINPPLSISGVPAGTKSLVLLLDDPDVPHHLRKDGMWDHWVIFNIPPNTTTILEGNEAVGTHGIGTSGNTAYEGPCPPDKEHRYFFKLFALDTLLSLPAKSNKREVEKAMQTHILEKTELMGRYAR